MFQTNQLESAERYLQAAHKLAPVDAGILYDLGLAHMAMRRYFAAAEEFQTVAKRQPKNAVNHVLLGRAFLNSNRTIDAIREFKQALAIDPKVPLGHYHLGFALGSLGRIQEAIAELRTELRAQPANPAVLSQLGHYLLESGDTASATTYLQRAVKAGATDAYYDLGKGLLQQSNIPAAIDALQRAAALSPDPSVYFQLSRAYRRAGDREQAKHAMHRYEQLRVQQESTGGMATARRQ
jgi:Flp pilus assembly protein TadD